MKWEKLFVLLSLNDIGTVIMGLIGLIIVFSILGLFLNFLSKKANVKFVSKSGRTVIDNTSSERNENSRVEFQKQLTNISRLESERLNEKLSQLKKEIPPVKLVEIIIPNISSSEDIEALKKDILNSFENIKKSKQ